MAGSFFVSIFVVFLTDIMGFSEGQASSFYGSFFALSWGVAPLGGLLIDRLFGARLSYILGSALLVVGYGLLGISVFTLAPVLVYPSFAIVLLGSGTSRACNMKLLSGIYVSSGRENEMHSGYALYYVFVNMAAILPKILAPTLRHLGSPHFAYGLLFSMASFLIVLTLVCLFLANKVLSQADQTRRYVYSPKSAFTITIGYLFFGAMLTFLVRYSLFSNILFLSVTGLTLVLFFYEAARSSKIEKAHLALIFFLSLEAVFFAFPFTEISTTLLFYEIDIAQPFAVFGHMVDPMVFQTFNPLWVTLLSPLFVLYYRYEERRRRSIPLPYKFAIGMALSSLAFFTLALSALYPGAGDKVSVFWLIGAHFLEATAEILISALGVSTVMRYAPQRSIGLVTGIWFLSRAVSKIAGGAMAGHAGMQQNLSATLSLSRYAHFFGMFGVITSVFFVLTLALAPLLTKLEKV